MEDRYRQARVELTDAQMVAVDRIKSLAEQIDEIVEDAVGDLLDPNKEGDPRQKGERLRLKSISITQHEIAVEMLIKSIT